MTAQVGDRLVYKKKTYSISSEPLNAYLDQIHLPPLMAPSTDCWRGYIAKWTIKRKQLLLIQWEGYISNYQKVGMEYLFPGEKMVFADWFTGDIRIGVGEIVNYVHYGYDSIYEGEMILKFINGVLVEQSTAWLPSHRPW
jgi:hypothetical protein